MRIVGLVLDKHQRRWSCIKPAFGHTADIHFDVEVGGRNKLFFSECCFLQVNQPHVVSGHWHVNIRREVYLSKQHAVSQSWFNVGPAS